MVGMGEGANSNNKNVVVGGDIETVYQEKAITLFCTCL
jgi:hypothetical protein